MQKHFVTFYSPGTLFHEETTKEIGAWDVEQAVEMAKGIIERYNSKPFGFRFKTIDKTGADWSVITETIGESPMHYLGGEILTLEEIEARNDPKDEILISNMKGNDWNRIIQNKNSWLITQPFLDGDLLIDFVGFDKSLADLANGKGIQPPGSF